MLRNKIELNITHHDLKKREKKKTKKKGGGFRFVSFGDARSLCRLVVRAERRETPRAKCDAHCLTARAAGSQDVGDGSDERRRNGGNAAANGRSPWQSAQNGGEMAGSGVTVALRARCGYGSGGAPRLAGTPTRGGASGGAPLPGALVRPGQPPAETHGKLWCLERVDRRV